ncbi:hypothetical protein POM88_018457 [Heracleum sosnowskyi]|uniref:Protein FAR1-RELATED SEQUENCE n=1 Tax=Heracleum sosnowskyi TaxID=360622 RepID=A0AAD8IQL3_9APIA|nr:hypothetical protein POM88_018457 [Heracleum sosnowskyi]
MSVNTFVHYNVHTQLSMKIIITGVKKSKSIEESEECWIMLCEKYKPVYKEQLTETQKNMTKSWKWIGNMYEKRCHWVKAYLRDTFFAGMKSSQRSEIINSFFDGYVNSNTPLSEFIEQYEKAIKSRRDTKEKEDLVSMTTTHDFTDMHTLEAHAARIYSRNIFKIVQNEFSQILHYEHHNGVKEGVVTTYEVDFKEQERAHIVKLDISTKFCEGEAEANDTYNSNVVTEAWTL